MSDESEGRFAGGAECRRTLAQCCECLWLGVMMPAEGMRSNLDIEIIAGYVTSALLRGSKARLHR